MFYHHFCLRNRSRDGGMAEVVKCLPRNRSRQAVIYLMCRKEGEAYKNKKI
jgi:hypothetical protein